MKKIIFTLLSLIFTISVVFSQSFQTSDIRQDISDITINQNKQLTATYVITHSPNQTIIDGISIACGSSGITRDNSYLRIFDLVNDFGINENITVSSVDFGINSATAASGGSQSITVNIYTLSGPLLYTNLTLIASQVTSVTDQDFTIFNVPISAFIPVGSVLVAEIFSADAGNTFFMGCNNVGSTDASYLVAAACGISDPITVTSIGFPDAQCVINVNAEPGSPSIPLSNWALGIGLLLISGFIVVRFRRRLA